ncbi:tRNA (guanine(46)-N(7))-methyltransferase TrmB [Alteromonas facilis]|uniref:tRNA (guanine(46)-N(7))-methyltransferase TrmB n=1 Tax=Alteromonas facilis TaxID=2048004 RepID=UPI000C283EFD|nr:SAM-dependent methyltransferase [Alteromonas facilis]
MQSQARSVTSTQLEPHEKLVHYVQRYQNSERRHVPHQHTVEAFNQCLEWLGDFAGDIIFDSCCGVGESTAHIARHNPHAKVIGIDKSALRLGKHQHYGDNADNYIVVRADVSDFWYLARQQGIKLAKHCLYYPNPYPKPSQVQKRWHASPAMPDFMGLGGTLYVRSNWDLLVKEFQIALSLYGVDSTIEQLPCENPITPFERKYFASGQICWALTSR